MTRRAVKERCGAWMPVAKERCAVGAGHKGKHYTRAGVENRRASDAVWRAANREKARASSAAWRSANPEKVRASSAAYKAANFERVRASVAAWGHLRKYGITLEDKAAILEAQGGCCAICKRTEPNGRGWHTDHDAETGVVRGVLCSSCNVGIGHLGHSTDALAAAIVYLQRSRN